MLHATIKALVEAGVLIGAGAFATNLGVFNSLDLQIGYKVAAYATLPAVALQVLSVPGTSAFEAACIASVSLAAAVVPAALGWLSHRKRRSLEQALLTGCSFGLALGTWSLPFIEAAFGVHGVRFALIWDMANLLAVFGISYLIMMAGGSPPPALYEHADGGAYRGEWLGPRKQGLGTYTYPSGGQYQGMWRDNLKEGYGIYTFPKGGWYEGEWVDGERHGSGVRLMRNGSIKAGRWQKGQLQRVMDPLECAVAVSGAQKAAQAARRLKVSRGGIGDALTNVASQPLLWASLAGIWLSASGVAMPLMVDSVSAALASAHTPLVLLCTGLWLKQPRPKGVLPGDTAGVLALRALPPLLAAAAAAACFPAYAWQAAAVGLCSLSPLPDAVRQHAKQARLNDAFPLSLHRLTRLISLAALPVLALVFSALNLPPMTTADLAQPPALPANAVSIALLAAACAWAVLCLMHIRMERDRVRAGPRAPKGAVRMSLQGPTPPVTILKSGNSEQAQEGGSHVEGASSGSADAAGPQKERGRRRASFRDVDEEGGGSMPGVAATAVRHQSRRWQERSAMQSRLASRPSGRYPSLHARTRPWCDVFQLRARVERAMPALQLLRGS